MKRAIEKTSQALREGPRSTDLWKNQRKTEVVRESFNLPSMAVNNVNVIHKTRTDSAIDEDCTSDSRIQVEIHASDDSFTLHEFHPNDSDKEKSFGLIPMYFSSSPDQLEFVETNSLSSDEYGTEVSPRGSISSITDQDETVDIRLNDVRSRSLQGIIGVSAVVDECLRLDDLSCISSAEHQASCMDKDDLDVGEDCATQRTGDNAEAIPCIEVEQLPSNGKSPPDLLELIETSSSSSDEYVAQITPRVSISSITDQYETTEIRSSAEQSRSFRGKIDVSAGFEQVSTNTSCLMTHLASC